MIVEKKYLFFKTANIILDDEKILPLLKSNKYSSIVVLSYNKLTLPEFLEYSKPTLLIDLRRSDDEIFSSFNDTTRNEIRKTLRDDQLRFIYKDSPDAEAYRVYSDFEYSQGRLPVRMNLVIDTLFFGIVFNNEIISGIFVNKSYPYLRIRSIFSKRLKTEDREIYRIIAYSTRRVVWEACLWGKKNGYISLDMASVNINNPKTESIAKFKMSFGKNLIPEYTYIYKSKPFAFFEKVVRIKVLLKKTIFKVKNTLHEITDRNKLPRK